MEDRGPLVKSEDGGSRIEERGPGNARSSIFDPQSSISLLCFLFAVLVMAASPSSEAEKLLDRGNTAFVKGEYETALSYYRQAEGRITDPGLLAFNEGAALYKLGRYREAEIHYWLTRQEAMGERLARVLYDLGNAVFQQAGSRDGRAGHRGPQRVTKRRNRSAKDAPSDPAAQNSVTPIGKTLRMRDRDHLKFVSAQPCLVCARSPSDAHHLKFAQGRALARKVSDEFTVPLCRSHHRELHRRGNERIWWQSRGIDPLPIAASLWVTTHAVASVAVENASNFDRATQLNGTHLTNKGAGRHQYDETKPIIGPEAG